MTEPIYVPCWLYHSEQGAKLFTTQAELDEAIAQGWADSPAAALRAVDIDLSYTQADHEQALKDFMAIVPASTGPSPDDGVVAALEAAEAAVEQVVSKKRKRKTP